MGADPRGRRLGRVARDVLDEVGEALVDERGVPGDRAAGRASMSTSTWRGPTTGASRSSTVRTASSTSSASRSGLISPAWIRLRSSRPPTIRSSRLVSSSISVAVTRTSSGDRSCAGIGERAGGRPDPGQRRAQVVRDGVDERALERRVAARDLGGEGLLPEPLAPDRQADLGRGEREEAGLGARRLRPVGGRDRPQRPDHLAVGLEPDLVAVLAAWTRGRRSTPGAARPPVRGPCVRTQAGSPRSVISTWTDRAATARSARPRCRRPRSAPPSSSVHQTRSMPASGDQAARDRPAAPCRGLGGEGARDPVQRGRTRRPVPPPPRCGPRRSRPAAR